FYSGALLDAQRFAARTIGARYRAHPAIAAWDLGNEFSNLRAPRTSTDAAAWSRGLTDELREASELPVTGGIHGEDLTQDRAIRPSSICAPWTFATMHGYSIYSGFARDRCDPAVVPFLAALTGACARKRVLFSEFGNPNCPAGTRPMFDRVALPGDAAAPGTAPPPGAAPFACLTDDELAVYADAVLTQLHAGGALGALWWCWADYDRRLAGEPPFDRAPHELHFGLIRSDGREKPVAGVLAAAARARRPIVDPPPPIVDEAAYYAALPGSTGRSYAAYLGRVRA
ncbi:MAG: hypothetical protein ACREM8_03580, partial [Vulcanimicrobiaceae bacterium]